MIGSMVRVRSGEMAWLDEEGEEFLSLAKVRHLSCKTVLFIFGTHFNIFFDPKTLLGIRNLTFGGSYF